MNRKSFDEMIDSISHWAAQGLQVRRKDKDQMSDTGGSSKGRGREPHLKPPRDDLKKRYKKKRKKPENQDKDTDNDKDLKKESSTIVSTRGTMSNRRKKKALQRAQEHLMNVDSGDEKPVKEEKKFERMISKAGRDGESFDDDDWNWFMGVVDTLDVWL